MRRSRPWVTLYVCIGLCLMLCYKRVVLRGDYPAAMVMWWWLVYGYTRVVCMCMRVCVCVCFGGFGLANLLLVSSIVPIACRGRHSGAYPRRQAPLLCTCLRDRRTSPSTSPMSSWAVRYWRVCCRVLPNLPMFAPVVFWTDRAGPDRTGRGGYWWWLGLGIDVRGYVPLPDVISVFSR